MSDAYNEPLTTKCNCWGTALEVAKSQDVDIYGGIPSSDEADEQLQKENQSIPEEEAVVGQSIVRFADPTKLDKNKVGGTTHYATYMGKDRSGRGYVFTKNGWVYKWDVQRMDDFHVPDNNKRPERGLRFSDYGLPTPVNGDLSPYYGPK
jgi:hypothetical protein